jgi:hypothetical protein
LTVDPIDGFVARLTSSEEEPVVTHLTDQVTAHLQAFFRANGLDLADPTVTRAALAALLHLETTSDDVAADMRVPKGEALQRTLRASGVALAQLIKGQKRSAGAAGEEG